MNYVSLSATDVAIAASLILINGVLSLVLRLGLGRQLLVAAVRTVVQLLAIGYLLAWVFQYAYWYVVVLLMGAMTLIAGVSGSGRGGLRYRGQRVDSIVSIWASAWLVSAVGLFAVMRIHPWYEPQYVIPILGMVLGNTLTGVSLGIERMTQELHAGRAHIEMVLSLGGSRWEAAQQSIRRAVRAGMLPTLNQMSVVGIVSLPGMMTGQILAGEHPTEAVRYQIVIMFLIAASSSLGTVGAVLLIYRRLFSSDHRFLAGKLKRR